MRVKPRKGGRFRRRATTISLYAVGWMLLTATWPIWLGASLLVGLVRRRHFIILRLLVFGWFYLGYELVALTLIGVVFLTERGDARVASLYSLQAWWATVNLRVASWLLRLNFDIQDAGAATPGPSILLIRHASILDTLLPCAFVQRPTGYRLRYVLKQELLFDPCIDIVGNALPNYFVDRTGDTAEELRGIRALVSDLGADGVLIFPEGTRFSQKKRQRALESLRQREFAWMENAESMTRVLPPKAGGVLTLLDALPGVDCVFFAHTGLERFAKIEDLLDGSVVGSKVRAKLWRVPRDEVPKHEGDRLRWLFAQWGEVDEFIRNPLETT